MFNPLPLDLSKLTDKELLTKLEELWRRGAYLRHHPAHTQIQILIQSYQAERERRQSGTGNL
jgi:hypothetical protein